jgi:hypothetical protein
MDTLVETVASLLAAKTPDALAPRQGEGRA